MSVIRKLRHMAAGAGLAVHSVLAPTTSNLEEPQSQSIPDKDYEGVSRHQGGAFKPADEVREDVWRTQSRNSPEADAFFYSITDKKSRAAYAKRNDLGSSDHLGHGDLGDSSVHKGELKKLEDAGYDYAAIVRQNDARWEAHKSNLKRGGRLHGEVISDHPAARALRTGLTEDAVNRTLGNASPHTCHDAPAQICHACLEANR